MHLSKVTWVGVDPWVVVPEKETGYKLMTVAAPSLENDAPKAVKASQVGVGELW